MELKVTVNQSEPKVVKILIEKVDLMKISLVKLTEILHSSWSSVHVSTAVSQPQVCPSSYPAVPVLS